MIARPWKAFVHDIGPTYSFATEAAARRRAEALIPEYAMVTVYGSMEWPLRRTVYRPGHQPHDEVFQDGQWVRP